MDLIKGWAKNVVTYELPRWDDLPDISLYLDQLLEYIHEILNPIFIIDEDKDVYLTAAMVNNYVKHKYIPAPVKKKYGKGHIAFIISITVLKQVTNLNNASQGTRELTSILGKEKAYDMFVLHLEKALKVIVSQLDENPDDSYLSEKVSRDLLPLKTVTLGFASKMLAEFLLANIVKNNQGEKHE